MKQLLSKYKVGDMILLYVYDYNQDKIGFSLLPEGMEEQVVIEEKWSIQPLVSEEGFTFCEQYTKVQENRRTIITTLRKYQIEIIHQVSVEDEGKVVWVSMKISNNSNKPYIMENIAAASICDWPMVSGENMEIKYKLHRVCCTTGKKKKVKNHTYWSQYGIQYIQGVQEQTKQEEEFVVGIMEDCKLGICIAAQVQEVDSWYMQIRKQEERYGIQVYSNNRKNEYIVVLQAGETYETKKVQLTTVCGDAYSAFYRFMEKEQEQEVLKKVLLFPEVLM
ncbi:hypothetical protein [Anaerosporobacter faecicola]|uniref:hypothetical protein n=1 Tax=Anaerosporobacter faecicola TaxID=2718714 RepID=UPI001439D803|nr:hypothetical protein [Anaerosporobacter faecicola]